ncbi:MAG TPA: DUF3761 domain-containing protein [Longimicrobium sp.]|nr:DUF3761 domain-containing protein [Longimicrobium sp.]
MLLLVFVGFCGTIVGDHGGGSGSPSLVMVDTASTAGQPHETLYAHGTMNIRAGAGTNFSVVRTVARGERLKTGPGDSAGWALVYDGYGGRIGYVYRASQNLRSHAPRSAAARPRRRSRTPAHPAGASAVCRDGSYSYSAHRRGTCSWHGGVAQWL